MDSNMASELSSLTAKASAYDCTLNSLARRKNSIEEQHRRARKGMMLVLSRLLELVDDELRFSKRFAAVWAASPHPLHSQPPSQSEIWRELRFWQSRFLQSTKALTTMTEKHLEPIKTYRDHAAELLGETEILHLDGISPVQSRVEKLRSDCAVESHRLMECHVKNFATTSTAVATALGFAAASIVFPPAAIVVGGTTGIGYGIYYCAGAIYMNLKLSKLEKEKAQLQLQDEELLKMSTTIDLLINKFNTTKTAAEVLDRDCLKHLSAMSGMVSRLSGILHSSTALEMVTSHENLIDCVEEIVLDFSYGTGTSDNEVQKLLALLDAGLKKLKADRNIVELLRTAEQWENYYK